MKIKRKALLQMIAEEVVAYEYEQEDGTTSLALDNELTSDVEAQEDSWAGGQNIHNQVDHLVAGGSEEASVRGVECLKITENQLRFIVRKLMLEGRQKEIYGELENVLMMEFEKGDGVAHIDTLLNVYNARFPQLADMDAEARLRDPRSGSQLEGALDMMGAELEGSSGYYRIY